MIRSTKIFLSLFSFLLAQSDMELGITAYNKRAEGSTGATAQRGPIDEAINYFGKAAKSPENELDAGIYLLHSYYFKGKFVLKDENSQKETFNKGKALAEKLIKKYPDSGALRYWYLVNLGSWAEVYGIITAAREGVADIMRTQSLKIIELDPNYGYAYSRRGAAKINIGDDIQGAFDDCQKAVELNPDDARVWGNLGLAYSEQGNYTKAIQSFEISSSGCDTKIV